MPLSLLPTSLLQRQTLVDSYRKNCTQTRSTKFIGAELKLEERQALYFKIGTCWFFIS